MYHTEVITLARYLAEVRSANAEASRNFFEF